MIKTININNFGSLINFSNVQCKFNKGKTIIHGMNGTGKSQICSILHQVEKLKNIKALTPEQMENEEKNIINYIRTRLSKEASSNKISINIDNYSALIDKNKITQNGNVPDIFVFNDDYVNDNIGDYLKIHDREIRIGRKNVERDKLIIDKQDKEEALRKVNVEIDKIVKKAKYNSGYSGQSRTDRIISKENYLKANNPGESCPDGKKELSELSNPPDLITEHQKYSFPSLLFDEAVKNAINEIMSNSYLEPELTQEFYKSYLKIKKGFYEDGVSIFNKSKNICPFCLSPKTVDDSSIKELINYIDSDFNDKLNYIQNIIEALEEKRKTLQSFISNWNRLIPVLKDKSKILLITDDIENIIFDESAFNNCISLLKTKVENMDKILPEKELIVFADYENYINNINKIYFEHNKKINRLNNKIDKIRSLKQSIGEKII